MNNQQRSASSRLAIGVAFFVLLLLFLGTAQALGQAVRGPQTTSEERAVDTFRQIYRFIQNNYVDEVAADRLLQGALKGMFESLDDPYSMFLSDVEMRSMNDTTQGEFGGVGLYINKYVPDPRHPEILAWVEIVSPIEDTPAFHAGLQAGDFITSVDGASTETMTIDEAVEHLRGRPGSSVAVGIRRGSANFTVNLSRAIIEVPTVKHETIGSTGYLRIIQFTPRTSERVAAALEDFNRRRITSIIVDVRSNPGGLLSSVIDVADQFFDNGLIVGTRGRVARENQTFNARPGVNLRADVPMIVLVDEGSASAAEILAGALRNRGRAALVGATTFGKGSVQQVRQVEDWGFRLTMSRYYTPGNVFIDKVGIPPDVEVKAPELTEAQQASLARFAEEERVIKFLDRTASPTAAQISAFVGSLRAEGFDIPERIVRRLVTLEVLKRTNTSQVYDLEFDIVLQKALEIIRASGVQQLIDSRPPLNADFAAGLPSPVAPGR